MTVTDAIGCVSNQSFTVNDIPMSNLNNLSAKVQYLEAFPNPNSGQVQVQWRLVEAEDVQIQVYDVTGRLLQSWQIAQSQEAAQSLDFSAYASGLYLLRFQAGQESWTRKLVKE